MRLTCVVENEAGRPDLRAEHGLCVLVETGDGAVLWDTGATGETLLHNLHALGIENTPIEGIALSHAHLDHTGGLSAFLKSKPRLPLYAHSDLFMPRFSGRDPLYANGVILRRKALERVTNLRLSREPQELLPGVYTTGSISPRPYPCGGSNHLFTLIDGTLTPDPYADDMSLVLRAGKEIVLLCGCCHAGLRNTVATVRRRFSEPLRAVVGGTHLHDVSEAELGDIVTMLRSEQEPDLYLNHCTGKKAIGALKKVFGDKVAPCPAGTILEF